MHSTMHPILHPDDYARTPDAFGGKAGALAALERHGFPIPPWFVVPPDAFWQSLTPDQRRRFETAADPQTLQEVLAEIRPGAALQAALGRSLAQLCPDGAPVAVRSSAGEEDGRQHSFAGQLESFLGVPHERVAEQVAAVWRSGFGERVLGYRRQAGLPLLPKPPAVLVQRMVEAEVSGVAFGADPTSGRRGICLISAVPGLGSALVSGEAEADRYLLDRKDRVVMRDIASKQLTHELAPDAPEGLRRRTLAPTEARRPTLSDPRVRAIGRLTRRAGRVLGGPQDVEWALGDGQLWLLQSRPITALAERADPDGALGLWDNSNIVESYGGTTTPLTFSFARTAYREVYRELLRILGVSDATIREQQNTFAHMLGYVRGRIYYNLLSWYRVLATLPGFQLNRRFMEQMMGVREGLPEPLVRELGQSGPGRRLRALPRLALSLLGLTGNFLALPRTVRRFQRRLERVLRPPEIPFETMRPDELCSHYHDLENDLLRRWDAPLVNDFFAMIFHGVLRRLCTAWCGDDDGSLANGLLAGQGGMVSAEPAERLRELARLAAAHPERAALLREGSLGDILATVEAWPAFKARYLAYLERFGDRCLEELKLETTTLEEDPLPLLRSVGVLAQQPAGNRTDAQEGPETRVRAEAEARARAALRFRPLRRLVFDWVLRHARARLRDRENLRFERTRVFGRARRLFLEMGRRLHADGLLDHPRDVFFLEVDEVWGFVEGVNTSTRLRELAALRKAELAGYRELEAPADRFETRGPIYQGNAFRASTDGAAAPSGETRSGLGSSPGVVQGFARVVTDPRNAVLEEGAILIAERTDPGWILLFPSAAGLVVERGSLLSHSAILARELGIPAVVSLEGATRWLRDGDLIELDGSRGVVRRIVAAEPGPAPAPVREVAHGT